MSGTAPEGRQGDPQRTDAEPIQLASSGSYRRLFANRDFRALWVGQTISGVGDWLVVGLLIPLVTDLSNGSTMAVAGIMIAKILPSLVLSSFLGVLVDRYDRRRLMIACDVINGALCLGLLATGSLFIIYLITFLMEICNLLFVPAKNALIPKLVEERDLAAANGLSYTTQQASMLIGLTMSGAIVALWVGVVNGVMAAQVPLVSEAAGSAPYLVGPRAGVLIDSVSFALSALTIAAIRVEPLKTRFRELSLRMLGADVVESLRFLRERKELRGFLSTIFLAILGGGAIIAVGPVYVQQNLVGTVPFLDKIQGLDRLASQSPQTFMLVFLAAGMLAGAFLVPRFAARLSLEVLFISGVAGFGVAMAGFSSVGVYWIASMFAVAAGFGVAQVTVAGNTFVAEAAPDEQRGRVFTALESVLRIALLLSMIVTAPIGDLVGKWVRDFAESNRVLPQNIVLTGPRLTLWFASAIVFVAAAYAMRAIQWRAGDRAEPARTALDASPASDGGPDE